MSDIKITEIPHKTEQYTLYIDRKLGDINGVMTLQRVINGQAIKIFEKLPFASGQYPYTDGGAEDWVTGKGPIPMNKPGENYWLSTKREPLQMEPVGTPFYVISSKQGERVIYGPGGKKRENVGVHLENSKPGSAACTALLHDNEGRKRKAWAFFAELDRLNKAGVQYIKVIVL